VVLDLNKGTFLGFKPQYAQGFGNVCSREQLRQVEISPSGLGLHSRSLTRIFMCPAARRFPGTPRDGRAGWQTVRENGKLGGRPKEAQAAYAHAR
jgi:hypothetical protein